MNNVYESRKDYQSDQISEPVKQGVFEESNAIYQLVELMKSVDINTPEAKLNATTISDGKGGRILL